MSGEAEHIAASITSREIEALHSRAVRMHQAGDLSEAGALYEDVLKAEPRHPEALRLLGLVHVQTGRARTAIGLIERALEVKPGYADAYKDLGTALKSLRRIDEAIAAFRKAIELQPRFAEAHNNLGNAFFALKRYDEAIASYERALALNPRYALARRNLAHSRYRKGYALAESDQPGAAGEEYRKVLALDPGYVLAYYSLGNVLGTLHCYDEALACFDKVLSLDPGNALAHNNRGFALESLHRHGEAMACYEKALAIKPDLAQAVLNKGMGLLRTGNFAAGWQGCEMRWQVKSVPPLPAVDRPLWLGKEPIAGKHLLIQFEQGLGDAIQMMRYVPMLEATGAQCWLQMTASLTEIAQRTFPRARVIPRGQWPALIDYRIPIMSLPLALRTFSESAIPAAVPYLIADEAKKAHWVATLEDTRRPVVGLVWRGNPGHGNERNRSARLEDFAPLLSRNDRHFVTLQKGLTAAERELLARHANVTVLDAELTSFDDTAAVICTMDAVVSVDTAPAHLAGALGRPAWVMLPVTPDWRWMEERSDSPWYPTMRLFRQNAPGDWARVIDEIAAALDTLRD